MEWLRVDSEEIHEKTLKKAAECLLDGGILVYPTETYYGLGALALDERAVTRVFKQKKRSVEKQLTVLISNIEILEKFVEEIPPLAEKLARKFWPGPVTIIMDARSEIAKPLKAATRKIGFRVSSHPVASKLAEMVGAPITATSANLSGDPPVNDPRDLPSLFLKGVDMVIDAGKTPGGAASTIVDVSGKRVTILRRGLLAEDVANFLKSS